MKNARGSQLTHIFKISLSLFPATCVGVACLEISDAKIL